jgi:hypothetical protein
VLNLIDKLIAKYGYINVDESKYGVYYEKQEPQNYIHVIGIIDKQNGLPLIQSYDKKTYRISEYDYINSQAGFEAPLLILLWLKWKQMKRKYKRR